MSKNKVNAGARRHRSRTRNGVPSFSSSPETPARSGSLKRSKPEIELALSLDALPPIPDPYEMEYRFHPTRKWRFDFAYPRRMIAVEVEGGVFSRGRHNRPSGFIADCEKYNEAQLLGWTVIRVVPRKGWIGETLAMIRRAYQGDL
jgi:hypothetical protein